MLEVCYIDWHISPLRTDRFLDSWQPVAAKVLAYGATSWNLTRAIDDTLHVRQASVWNSRSDFERYWFSDEISAEREKIINLYDKPLLPAWHTLLGYE